MMRLFLLISSVSVVALSGCGGKDDDLRQWMAEQGKTARSRPIEALPQMKPYEPFTYNAAGLPDPFTPRKVDVNKPPENKLAPDLNRRREALEAFPLENLKMVGTLQQKGQMIGLVRTSDNRVFQVRPGNYLGQNFGVLTKLSDSEILLKELVQDGAGEWTERTSTMRLIEQNTQDAKGQKK